MKSSFTEKFSLQFSAFRTPRLNLKYNFFGLTMSKSLLLSSKYDYHSAYEHVTH